MSAISAYSCTSSYEPQVQQANLIQKKFARFNTLLLFETIIVTIAAIGIIKLLSSSITNINHLTIPVILMTAALVPTVIRGHRLKHIGLNIKNARLSIRLLLWASFLILPSAFLVIWLLKLCGINSPLQQSIGLQSRWTYWIVYQFLYVAITEEVFFRGYLQSNIIVLLRKLMNKQRRVRRYTAVFVSALCFAAAHVVILSQIAGILTFFPGLVFGWLFLRTRSLVAPVLFHGLANTCYCLICCMVLT
jgi:membrane protease YdiL (CAAX protease family)